jgi:hypothetical protein
MYCRGPCDAKPGTTSEAPLLVDASDGGGEVAEDVANDCGDEAAEDEDVAEGSCDRPEKHLKVRPSRMGS